MRLIEDFAVTEWERQHVWPCEQAVEIVREALLNRQSVEGLDQLRAGLMINLDSEVLEQIERAQWHLVRPEADYMAWKIPNRAFDPKVLALNPHAQPARSPQLFRLVASVTGEPFVQRRCLATVQSGASRHRTDGKGIAHLFVPTGTSGLSLQVPDA